jgi:urease accessory protein UreH
LELRGPFRGKAGALYYLRNITAGVFANDRYEIDLTALPGADLTITSSSATKVHAAPSGTALSATILHAKTGSRLTCGPTATILQQGSAFSQTTEIEIEEDSIVLVAEVIALGRLARGECLDFQRFESNVLVRRGDEALYEERYVLTPDDSLLLSLGGKGVLVSVYGFGVDAVRAIEALEDRQLSGESLIGFSALPNDAGVVVRALSVSLSDGMALTARALAAIRE